MRAAFERGDASTPRGHALLFFREVGDRDQIRACYLVITPIEMDFAKYVPPMFAGQLAGLIPSGPAALPLPPIPELVESLAWLERLADARDDDLLDGGTIDASNPQHLMMTAAELAGEYAALWTQRAARLAEQPLKLDANDEPAALPDVEGIFISVMSDAEKVERLAKLSGTLRYAVELDDAQLTADTVAQMERVGRHLPPGYRFDQLLAAGRAKGTRGGRLLQLHVERCARLAAEDYADIEHLDRQIAELEA